MPSVFPDYKYFNLIHGRHVRRDRLLNLRSPCLRPVAKAFYQNVARMDSFSVFPSVVAAEALQKQLWRDYAVFKVTGALSAHRSRPYGKKKESAIQREIQKLAKAEQKRWMSGKAQIRDKIKRGADRINEMLSHEVGANQSMEAILFSVVIESWTAFETLAADLWFVALDHGPAEWRTRTLAKSSKFKKGNDLEVSASVDPNRASDPHEKFGSALRDADKISFQKLGLITFWYKTAFGQDISKVFKQVPYISALSAVRNVINHKAGIADSIYVNAVKDFPELSNIKPNELIQLNGEIVREMENAALLLGGNLVLYVDSGLTPKEQGSQGARRQSQGSEPCIAVKGSEPCIETNATDAHALEK